MRGGRTCELFSRGFGYFVMFLFFGLVVFRLWVVGGY